jgi:hypothetical protein
MLSLYSIIYYSWSFIYWWIYIARIQSTFSASDPGISTVMFPIYRRIQLVLDDLE